MGHSVLSATVTFSADRLNLQHATFGEPSGGTFISHTAKRVSCLESFSSRTSTCEAKTDNKRWHGPCAHFFKCSLSRSFHTT
jgi:hypothetical protein